MKISQSSLVLIFSLAIGFAAAQEDFVVGDTCVFPVVFYVANNCNAFWARPVTNITADGQCNNVPPSQYTDLIGPGPYYRAVCGSDGATVKFTAAGCSDSTCTQCAGYNAYLHGPGKGVFDMTNLQCQDLQTASFVSLGPLDVRAEPVPTGTPPTTMSPTVAPVVPATQAPVPLPTEAPTTMPVPPPTAPPVAPCNFDFRFYNRTCSNLVAPQERSQIIADGVCRDSGIPALGFYQAMCDGTGGVVFLKNKCLDATCQACDLDPDVYVGTSNRPSVCRDAVSTPVKSWTLFGNCSRPSCGVMTRAASTFSLVSNP